jgi:hypothetical protein
MTFNPHPISNDFPHFFISNNIEILEVVKNVGWTPIFLEGEISDDPVISATQAKIAKAVPNRFEELSNFDWLFYKDDKINFDVNRLDEFISLLNENNSPIGIRKHPFLPPNVLYEHITAHGIPRYAAQLDKIIQYITTEVKNGYKLDCENLYWTSAILRNNKHPDVNKINETWYEHISRCGIECQISFHFIAQQFPNIVLLPDNLC